MHSFSTADRILKTAGEHKIINLWGRTDDEYVAHHEQFCCVPATDTYIEDTLAILPTVSGLSGLDVGCGAGVLTQKLTTLGARMHVTDINKHAVDNALRFGAVSGKQASIEKLPFETEEFDFCICTDVIEHVVDFSAALDELCRVTKRGGFIIISLPNAGSTQVILIDLLFPLVKGFAFKVLGKPAPRPSRGHLHLLSETNIKKEINARGMSVSEVKLSKWKDGSRNRHIVNTITSIVGLVNPKSKNASMILRVTK